MQPAWRFLPASFVAGDVFNVHAVDEHRTCFYLLDVAGHGVPSAMLSFTLSKLLAPTLAPDGLVKRTSASGAGDELTPPADVLRELNRRFQDDSDIQQYFTMVYGVIDARRNIVTLAQAGHPSPLLQRGGEVTRIGESGYPVGMLPDLEYEQHEFPFAPGDRLYLYSDGVTECANPEREQFKVERLERCIQAHQADSVEQAVEGVEHELRAWRGTDEFQDDITLLAIERKAA